MQRRFFFGLGFKKKHTSSLIDYPLVNPLKFEFEIYDGNVDSESW